MNDKYQSKTAQKGFSRRNYDRGAPVEKPKEGKRTIRRLLLYFKAEMPQIVLMTAVVTAGVAASVLAPGYQSSAIDFIIAGSSDDIRPFLVKMLAAYAVYGISLLIQGYISASLSQKVTKNIRSDLFRKIVHLPLNYLDHHSHGDLMSRMTNDADNISTVISTSLSSLFSGILTLAGTLIMMMYYSIPLALLSCSTIVVTILITRILTKKMQQYYLERQQLLGTVNGETEEMITNNRTITAYHLENDMISSFDSTSDQLTHTGIITEIVSGSMGPLMNMLSNCAFVIVAVFGAWFALKGWITVGVISAFIVYSKQFSRPINEIAQLYGQVETALAGAERIFAILDEPAETKDGLPVHQPVEGIIDFRHVNFSYIPSKEVIQDYTLQISSGKKIALVGATGSGKTTIINLLMRFYDIDSGEILLDGQDIESLSLSSLRSCVGIVLQDTVLFSDTVRANLTYGNPQADEKEIKEAAHLANCDSFIEQLPHGYDTVLDESGSALSQGQRQLIAIARAFLANPRILILDEATSSVDTMTERNIQDAMTKLMKDRTSLIVAHRLSTVQDADEIVVMDHGRIVERGNHEELLKKQGKYYHLYMTQFAGKDI